LDPLAKTSENKLGTENSELTTGVRLSGLLLKFRVRSYLYAPQELCYKPNIEHTASSPKPFPGVNSAAGVREPFPAHQHQDAIFAPAFELLRRAIADRAFPAASVAVTYRGNLVALKAFGRFTYEANSPAATVDTIFDLASLTKVVATTSMAMILYERGLLDLDLPAAAVVAEFAGEDSRRDAVTLRMLLAHSSGLPAYQKLFLRAKTRDDLLSAAFATPLAADPGTKTVYSDIGFIVLGVALERIADDSLDRFCQHQVFGPLAMTHTAFNPPSAWRASIPPTADDQSFRHRIIQGEVQDENASVMGGVAPHAGLFASAGDLAIFAHAMLSGGCPILRPETVALFTRRASSPPGTSQALGWDTPSSPSQSGKYFSANSFGHLGYTGTSLWIDPDHQLSITLLTNRTWPDCKNEAIKQLRPKFHDAVVESFKEPVDAHVAPDARA
jgi:CubicO group peptidase (beta-lactamase class C family)